MFNAEGLVFAARRKDTKEPAWQFPQGGIDAEEEPAEAMLRELGEEIGTSNVTILAETKDWLSYDLPVDLADRMWHGLFRGQRQKWFAARFLGTDGDINVETKHPEFLEWRWMPLAEVPALIVPFKRGLYDAVVREFARFAVPG